MPKTVENPFTIDKIHHAEFTRVDAHSMFGNAVLEIPSLVGSFKVLMEFADGPDGYSILPEALVAHSTDEHPRRMEEALQYAVNHGSEIRAALSERARAAQEPA